MNARTNILGPTLGDVYPPFREAMERYQRLVNEGKNEAAESLYLTAQIMAAAFAAGADHAGGRK